MNTNETKWINDHAADGELEMKSNHIAVSRITLLYTCHPCNESASQELGQITESGTAICPDCGNDMQLDEFVELESE